MAILLEPNLLAQRTGKHFTSSINASLSGGFVKTVSGTATAILGQLVARGVGAALSGDGSITLPRRTSRGASVSGDGTLLCGAPLGHKIAW